MGIPSWLGRDGIRIRESGLGDLIFHLESASESGGSAALDGDGVIGDSTGITGTRFMAAADISREVERSITGTATTEAEASGADLTVPGADPTVPGADPMAPAGGRRAAEFTTVPAQAPGLSRETGRRLEDTLHPVARAAFARVRSAATITVESPGAIPPEETPAWAAVMPAADLTAEAVVTAEAVIVEPDR